MLKAVSETVALNWMFGLWVTTAVVFVNSARYP